MTLTDEELERLRALAPSSGPKGPDERALRVTLDALLQAEQFRRGERDPVSGAFHVFALTQGSLLRQEYDLSTHGHYEGWDIGAVIVDIQRLILVNQEHGFPTGDAVLRSTAQALEQAFPSGKTVRIHGDAFAVLLPPSAERAMDAALEATTLESLKGRAPVEIGFSVSLLKLTFVKPSHWQVLGPLVWAECERALVMRSRGQASGIQLRRIELDAAIPGSE